MTAERANGFGDALERQRSELVRFVERRAGGALLRMETAEDLAQDIAARALHAAAGFQWRDEAGFRAWLFEIARHHLDDRRDYWATLKRAGSQVLRLDASQGGARVLLEVQELAASITGPSTFAAKREQIAFATRALALLLPRDRELVESAARGETARAFGEAHGLSPVAAESARKRALERFRKAFELIVGRRA